MQRLFAAELTFLIVFLFINGVCVACDRWCHRPRAVIKCYVGKDENLVLRGEIIPLRMPAANIAGETSVKGPPKGKSLSCYVCRSDEDSACVDKIPQSLAVKCPLKYNSTQVYCRTITQKLIFTDDNNYVYIRECAYQKGGSHCYYFKWLEIAFQETCECDSDYCNHGLNIVPTDWILTVTFSFWLLIYLTKR